MFGNMMDEIDCGNFFDNIDDILDDFPIQEDIESVLPLPNCDSFPTLWPNDSDSLPSSDSVFSGTNGSDLSAELSVPYDDIVQLEWLSNFVEVSFAGGEDLTMKKNESSNKEDSSQNQFQSSSPISVLESSSSCSGGEKTKGTAPPSPEAITHGRCGRARSKRPRPATFNPRPAIQLVSPADLVSEASLPSVGSKPPSDTKNCGEYRNIIRIPKHVITEHKKKKKMKLSVPSSAVENNLSEDQNESLLWQPVRKCMHCEITKTPQWRAGPMGPKTLCNACGVRYKSGRLFPEYRPAASPTFVPSLHSNSHKKVVEMRSMNLQRVAAITNAAEDEPASPVLIPNNNIPINYN